MEQARATLEADARAKEHEQQALRCETHKALRLQVPQKSPTNRERALVKSPAKTNKLQDGARMSLAESEKMAAAHAHTIRSLQADLAVGG